VPDKLNDIVRKISRDELTNPLRRMKEKYKWHKNMLSSSLQFAKPYLDIQNNDKKAV
jgi:hypothetical protein